MAKSVLDLYELYNLVIARGGLVDVINKKLWQEIIKGLHLPSSITSAAFTLRTQYMKYLYPYECEKRRLSTPSELQAAIDGNRREGRRTSYGSYPDMMRRSPVPNHHLQMSPLGQMRPQNNGHLQHPALHPALAQPPHPANPISSFVPPEFEARMVEYMKMLNKELRGKPPHLSPPSPPTSTSPREALSALDMGRLQLWNLYNNNHTTTPEPQKEALDLGRKEDFKPQLTVKREPQDILEPPMKKILRSPEPKQEEENKARAGTPDAHIKITSHCETRNQDGSLVVSMEINGITYQGVLFAQSQRAH